MRQEPGDSPCAMPAGWLPAPPLLSGSRWPRRCSPAAAAPRGIRGPTCFSSPSIRCARIASPATAASRTSAAPCAASASAERASAALSSASQPRSASVASILAARASTSTSDRMTRRQRDDPLRVEREARAATEAALASAASPPSAPLVRCGSTCQDRARDPYRSPGRTPEPSRDAREGARASGAPGSLGVRGHPRATRYLPNLFTVDAYERRATMDRDPLPRRAAGAADRGGRRPRTPRGHSAHRRPRRGLRRGRLTTSPTVIRWASTQIRVPLLGARRAATPRA